MVQYEKKCNYQHVNIIKMISKKRLVILAVFVSSILLIPLIAMQFTTEVNWQIGDFGLAASLLMGTGLLIDWITQKVKSANYRAVLVMVVVFIFILIWIELAVGIFGSPLAGS